MITEFVGVVWKKIPWGLRRFIVRVTQDRFTVSAAAVIRNPDGKVLLLDHRVRPASGWGLPGGFLEHGEQPEAGVRREIREETGLELSEIKLARVRSAVTHIEIIFTAVSDGEPEIRSREIKGFGWFDPSDIPGDMDAVHRRAIERVLNEAFDKNRASY